MVRTRQPPETIRELRPIEQHTTIVSHPSPKHHVPSQTSERAHHHHWLQLVSHPGHYRNSEGLDGVTSDAWWVPPEVNATAAQSASPAVRAITPESRISSASTSGDGSYGASEAVFTTAGRRSGSWGGTLSFDREFLLILGAGVDVYKLPSAHSVNPRKGVVPQRLKNLWSRENPMDDASQGLVTLFLDTGREHLCWCLPGAVELVPDPQYILNVNQITQVTPGYELRPRCIFLRSAGRPHALIFEVDSDELYDVLLEGFGRFLARNAIRDGSERCQHPHAAVVPTQPG